MRTTLKKSVKMMLATGMAALLTACDTDTSAAKNMPVYKIAGNPPPVTTQTNTAATNAAPDQLAAGATNLVEQSVVVSAPTPPANLKLSDAALEVVKLSESGLEEKVIIAFVESSGKNYALGSDEILYLMDLGVPAGVITAMINVSKSNAAAIAAAPSTNAPQVVARDPGAPPLATATEAPPQYPVVTSAAPPAAVEVAPAEAVATTEVPAYVAVQPTTQVTYSYFYSSLAPYGYWVDVPSYGLCWQPTVAVVQPAWRPYSDRGRWLYSDCGWYWHSDYSWGWAPFHYGRWTRPVGFGWVWVPDTTWGPSWVTWRNSGNYCGWAPLPPGSRYRSGVGFSFHDSNVGVSFGFGLSQDHYTFVPKRHFVDRNPSGHAIRSRESTTIYKDSTVINNYIVGSNNQIINEGIGRSRIESATRSEIKKVAIRDQPVQGTMIRPDRLERAGNTPVIYRPPAPPVKTDTTEVIRAQEDSKRSGRIPSSAIASVRVPQGHVMPGMNARPNRPATGTTDFTARPVPSGRPQSPPSTQAAPSTGGSETVTSRPVNGSPNAFGNRPGPGPRDETVRQSPQGSRSTLPQRAPEPTVSARPNPIPSTPALNNRPSVAPRNEASIATPQNPAVRQPENTGRTTSVPPIVNPLPGSQPNYSSRPGAVLVPPANSEVISRSQPSRTPETPSARPQQSGSRGPTVYELPSRQEGRGIQVPNNTGRTPEAARVPSQNYSAPTARQNSVPSYTPPAPTYAPPAVRNTPAPTYNQPAVRSTPAPTYAPPAIRSTPTPTYNQPAVRPTPVPSYTPPAYTPPARANPVPSYSPPAYSPPAVRTVPSQNQAPAYSPPAVRSSPPPAAAPAPQPQRSSPPPTAQPSGGRSREERRQ